MPKNLFEDIKPISREPRTVKPAPASPEPLPPLPQEIPYEPYEPKAPRRSSRYALWYIAAACVIGFLFSISFLFEHASVTITPKSVPVAFDTSDSFTAQKDGTDPDTIIYTQMTLSGDESIKLPSTQSKTDAQFAAGRVLLYNTYSTAAYKLVKGTRLATPDGHIYKIDAAASIPGYTKTKDGTVTPGSVEVSVTAALSGEGENIAQSDFTVPGLAGTAQAAKIYGRTKTAIAGGISGTIYTIPADAANAALGTLQTKLKTSLIEKAKVQVPDGYMFFPGATVFATDDSVQAPYSKEQQVPIALHGTLTAYLIKTDTLITAIAENAVSQYNSEAVTIPKLASLAIVPSAPLSPQTDQSFSFTLLGSADVIWTIHPEDIQEALAGKKKADFQNILGEVTGVERAEVTLKPFWKRSFPTDASRIGVSIQNPS